MKYTYANLSNSSKQVIIQKFCPPLNLNLWTLLGLSEIINIQEREQFHTEVIGKTIECIDEFLTSPIKCTENFYEMVLYSIHFNFDYTKFSNFQYLIHLIDTA